MFPRFSLNEYVQAAAFDALLEAARVALHDINHLGNRCARCLALSLEGDEPSDGGGV